VRAKKNKAQQRRQSAREKKIKAQQGKCTRKKFAAGVRMKKN